jgi:folate-binding protein YgfZ
MSDAHPLPQGACPLPDWGILQAEGPDAAAFLHAQLTQSIADMAPGVARLGGYCSAKGRLMATFIVRRDDAEHISLVVPRDVLPGLLKRLSMFVLRAKVKLSDRSADDALWGVLGDAVPALAPWQHAGAWLVLPDAAGSRRALHWGPPSLPALPRAAWDWAEVHAGIAWVRAATAEHFVPQMVNWELVGGVHFQKGCYPGQEVVARSQYRGTVKRRAQLLLGGVAAPGAPVFDGPGRDNPVGEVLQAAEWDGQAALLAEVQLAAWEAEVAFQLEGGQALHRGALPYPVKAPE